MRFEGAVAHVWFRCFAHIIRDAVPNAIGPRGLVFERLRSARSEAVVPAIERRWSDAEHFQGKSCQQLRLLDEADDLELLGAGERRRNSTGEGGRRLKAPT